VPELSRRLEACLQGMAGRRDLHELLGRDPAERDELVPLLRLAADLESLAPPPADPALRLRIRNRMLAAAARHRRGRRWYPLARTPRAVGRLAAAAAIAAGLTAGGLTAAGASGSALPGDPLYAVKIGLEHAQLTSTLDAGARAQLELRFADARLAEAQALFQQRRVDDGVRLVGQYDAALAKFNLGIARRPIDERLVSQLSRFLDERSMRDAASLKALAGTVGGDPQLAAAVAQTQSRVDQAWRGSKESLRSRYAQTQPASRPAKPAGSEP
jgi:uncharacterized protein DUF5667